MRGWNSVWALSVAGLILGLTGSCASKYEPREDATTMDLRHIARAYESVQASRNRPPKDVEEIRAILAELQTVALNGPPEEVLASARDGQPYVILLGVNLGTTATAEIFIYEKDGKDGKRYVMTTQREVREISATEFSQAKFFGNHKP